jgi:hypothetical protein
MYAVLLALAAGCAPAAHGPRIEWVGRHGSPPTAVRVVGVDSQALQQFAEHARSPFDWQKLLAVRLDLATSAGSELPAMLGAYLIDGSTLQFVPQFPLNAGATYRAIFDPGVLAQAPASLLPAISSVHHVPAPTGAAAKVENVFPSGPAVPENLLKFYVHFSAPMSGGSIYEHVRLLDDSGKAIDLPFLEIGEELWDPQMKRLTLIIDPGRIKRGVRPLEEVGPALQSGQNVTLVIDRSWKDASGRMLREEYRKSYGVEAADRTPPDPARWRVHSPDRQAGPRAPVLIDFGEPLDSALALRLIGVQDASGTAVGGTVGLRDAERIWSFSPDREWSSGDYSIVASSTLEDLAGNNIGKPFDVDLEQSPQPVAPRTLTRIAFQVR